MNSFLKKCKKAFSNKNLILLYGKYPFDNSIIRDGCFLTKEQRFICNLIIKTGLPFIIEYKINAPHRNHYYCDILVKTKYHLISFEVDGRQHYTQKAQRKRDLRKALYLLDKHDIYTIRIKNEKVNNYLEDSSYVDYALSFLYKNLFENKPSHIVKSERIGEIKKRIELAKKGIFEITKDNYVF